MITKEFFDRDWYKVQVGEINSEDEFTHYLNNPAADSVSPHPLYDPEYHISRNPSGISTASYAFENYLNSVGSASDHPHPLFDGQYYRSQLSPEESNNTNALIHYLRYGWHKGLRPAPWFDPATYISLYPDVHRANLEPFTHFVRFGRAENRYPAANVGKVDKVTLKVCDSKLELRPDYETRCLDRQTVGVFIHIHYPEIIEEIAAHLKKMASRFELHITTTSPSLTKEIKSDFERWNIKISSLMVVKNRGYDILPFARSFKEHGGRYKLCLKLHAKKSTHSPSDFSMGWRHHLYSDLLGSPEQQSVCLNAFTHHPDLGILIPPYWEVIKPWAGVASNRNAMNLLLEPLHYTVTPETEIHYPAGSMFWFRPEAIATLMERALQLSEKFENNTARDGELAHAVERLFVVFAADSDWKWAFVPKYNEKYKVSAAEARSIVLSSGLFDEEYYINTYKDIEQAGVDPLEHWINNGNREGRKPSASFDPGFYSKIVGLSPLDDVNPIVHYIKYGKERGLETIPQEGPQYHQVSTNIFSPYTSVTNQHTYVADANPFIRKTKTRTIAFYLPQFHPFPENDRFWGKGFTEWTNTTKAQPMFDSHNQPRLPGELGFYDLRLKSVIEDQIALAKKYGLSGFCLHHYFFGGKKVMRAPYDIILANADLDIPFCLNWANEPWTVRFDGLSTGRGTLIEQTHSEEDDYAFFEDILPALKDKRYITVEGRPLLLIYRPGLFPDIKATVARWRSCCERAGIPYLYLATVETSFEPEIDPKELDFDATVEFPPHLTHVPNESWRYKFYDPRVSAGLYDYHKVVDEALSKPKTQHRRFRGAMMEWDCAARRAAFGSFINYSPSRFAGWMANLFEKEEAQIEDGLIFVNAWNEWAEGTYFEPDRRRGYANLNALADSINKYRRAATFAPLRAPKLLVIAHIFYNDLAAETLRTLNSIPYEFDVLITTNKSLVEDILTHVEEHLGSRKVRVASVENYGFDIAPFINCSLPIAMDYDLCLKIHAKKTPYNSEMSGWRDYLYWNLCGSEHIVQAIVEKFMDDSKLGIVWPSHFPAVRKHVEWGSNKILAQMLCERMGVDASLPDDIDFPSGSMFWFRPQSLSKFLEARLTDKDYGDPRIGEAYVADGSYAHAAERLFTFVAEESGFNTRQYSFAKL